MAAAHGVYDHSRDFVNMFSGGLHHLSCGSGRKIFGIHRVDRRRLLPDTRLACAACFCDVAPGDLDTYSSFPPAMGSTQAHRTLDNPDLAVRVGDGRSRVLDALQMVSAGRVIRCETLR